MLLQYFLPTFYITPNTYVIGTLHLLSCVFSKSSIVLAYSAKGPPPALPVMIFDKASNCSSFVLLSI